MSKPQTRTLAAIVALATLAFIVMVAFWPDAAAGGWLIAFLFCGGISIGSLAWLMIHQLTGGRWGRSYGQVFGPAAAMIVPVGLLLVPIFVLLPQFYPWLTETSALKADVTRYFLNTPAFIARSVVAFLGWTLILFALARYNQRTAALAAAVGLVFYGLVVGFVGLDWIQSIAPPFFSTSFGMSLAVTQLMSALAWAAVVSPSFDRDASDLGGLMLSTVLGLAYLDFMTYLIEWYGDVPSKVEWFVVREAFPWIVVAISAFLLISLVPTLALLLSRVRGNAAALRVVGAIILGGVFLQYAWLIGPKFSSASLVSAVLAIVAISGGLVLIARTWSSLLLVPRRSAHAE